MDLTDKIDTEQISINRYTFDYMEYKYGTDHCLKSITPKVAIDFADWIASNYDKIPALYLKTPHAWCKKSFTRGIFGERFTSEQLFQEFLKDYEYGY